MTIGKLVPSQRAADQSKYHSDKDGLNEDGHYFILAKDF